MAKESPLGIPFYYIFSTIIPQFLPDEQFMKDWEERQTL